MTYRPINYFGTGADGAFTSSGGAGDTFASTLDGDVVVKHFTSFTVQAGHTVTVSNRCKGLVIYCTGDATINGTLHMNSKGTNAAATAGTRVHIARRLAAAIYSVLGGDLFVTVRDSLSGGGGKGGTGGGSLVGGGSRGERFVYGGGSGSGGSGGANGAAASSLAGGDGAANGGAGSAAVAGATGAGGGGGGSGGGTVGVLYAGTLTNNGVIRASGGAAGANGSAAGAGAGGGGGGAGIAGGAGGAGDGGGGAGSTGGAGVGGIIVLVVRGDLTIGAAGIISADGAAGGAGGAGSGAVVAAATAGADGTVVTQQVRPVTG